MNGRELNFRERTLLDTARKLQMRISGPEAYDAVRHPYDAVASIIWDNVPGEFWDYLKAQLGIDPQLSCCPVCGGVTPPAKHLHCLAQLGEWPARGTGYNDDI